MTGSTIDSKQQELVDGIHRYVNEKSRGMASIPSAARKTSELKSLNELERIFPDRDNNGKNQKFAVKLLLELAKGLVSVVSNVSSEKEKPAATTGYLKGKAVLFSGGLPHQSLGNSIYINMAYANAVAQKLGWPSAQIEEDLVRVGVREVFDKYGYALTEVELESRVSAMRQGSFDGKGIPNKNAQADAINYIATKTAEGFCAGNSYKRIMSSKISKQRYLALMQRVLDHIADKQDLVSYHDVFCALKEKGILLTRGDSVCLNVFLNTQGEALQIREFLTSKESFDKDYSQIEGIFPVTGENSGKYVFSDKEMKNVVSNFFFMLHLESAGIDAKEVGIRQVFGKFSSAVAATGSRILCQ